MFIIPIEEAYQIYLQYKPFYLMIITPWKNLKHFQHQDKKQHHCDHFTMKKKYHSRSTSAWYRDRQHMLYVSLSFQKIHLKNMTTYC